MVVLNVAFYRFTPMPELSILRRELRLRAVELGLKGTILLAPEGINGFLAGERGAVRQFLDELCARIPALGGMPVKESHSDAIPFQRMLVKLKREIIASPGPITQPPARRVEPSELKRWLDENRELVLLDTRNDYEVKHGTFAGAVDLNLRTFRQFGERARELPPSVKEKTVVMFCTGGIRCEKATALAEELGFRDVYQLEGGILRYFEECGRAHYEGECFVFDERVAL